MGQRHVVYVDGAGEEYMVPPSDVGRRRSTSHGARTVEGFSDSSITDPNSLPVRFPGQPLETQYMQGSSSQAFDREPAPYINRMQPQEPFLHPEPALPLDQQSSTAPPFVAPPGEVYMGEPIVPPIQENVSPYTQDPPPLIHGEPRRFRARRGQPITIGGVRIEVNDDGRRRSHRSHRSRTRSRSRSVDSHSSGVSEEFHMEID